MSTKMRPKMGAGKQPPASVVRKFGMIDFGKVDTKTWTGLGVVLAVLAVYFVRLWLLKGSGGKKAPASKSKAKAAPSASPKRSKSPATKKAASPAPAAEAEPVKSPPARASRSRSKTPAKKAK